MSGLFLPSFDGGTAVHLTPRSLRSATNTVGGACTSSFDERWLQECLFHHPELILLERMEPGAGEVMPVCISFPISRGTGPVFLDILGVTRTGRLVLVECKLWRNPQARREVIAQILEYAALLRRMSFGDLSAILKRRLSTAYSNPLFVLARERWPQLNEAQFVDGVSRSLEFGDFHLIVAGDGIRSDLQSVSAPAGAERRAVNRAFWQHFIDNIEFDHPEQAKPRHGGDNWVRIPLPHPIGWLTVFRSTGSKPVVGLFITLKDDAGEALYEQMAANLDALKDETGLNLIAKPPRNTPFSGELGVYRPRSQLPTDAAQLAWLNEATSQFVSALRLQASMASEAAE